MSEKTAAPRAAASGTVNSSGKTSHKAEYVDRVRHDDESVSLVGETFVPVPDLSRYREKPEAAEARAAAKTTVTEIIDRAKSTGRPYTDADLQAITLLRSSDWRVSASAASASLVCRAYAELYPNAAYISFSAVAAPDDVGGYARTLHVLAADRKVLAVVGERDANSVLRRTLRNLIYARPETGSRPVAGFWAEQFTDEREPNLVNIRMAVGYGGPRSRTLGLIGRMFGAAE